jgi:hypothetical protein
VPGGNYVASVKDFYRVCSGINEESNGNYNCTWNSTDKPEGNWTVNIIVEKRIIV